MRIGIIGAGSVGGTLGRGLANAGHAVTFGVRDPGDAKHAPLASGGSTVAGVREAVERSELVIVATPWAAAQAAVESAGDLGGRVLVDATNPIGPGFKLTHGHTDSGAEQVARWAKNARVVKAFNTVGVEVMANPVFGGAKAAMFIAGDDEAACIAVLGLARDLGFDAYRLGALTQARLLEPLAMVWITMAMPLKHGREMALALVRR